MTRPPTGSWDPQDFEALGDWARGCRCADDNPHACARMRDLAAPVCGCRCHYVGHDRNASRDGGFKARRYEGWTRDPR